eukprot:7377475-Prymnesium_polylepis.1
MLVDHVAYGANTAAESQHHTRAHNPCGALIPPTRPPNNAHGTVRSSGGGLVSRPSLGTAAFLCRGARRPLANTRRRSRYFVATSACTGGTQAGSLNAARFRSESTKESPSTSEMRKRSSSGEMPRRLISFPDGVE